MTGIRHFVYLNRRLVRELLAPLEGGIYDNEAATDAENTDRGLETNISPPGLHISGRLGKKRTAERTRDMVQTAASEFGRLHRHLCEGEKLQWLEALDADIWDQLKVGELLELHGRVPRRAPVLAGLRRITRNPGEVGETGDVSDLVVRLRGSEEYGFFGTVSREHFVGEVKRLMPRRLEVWQWPPELRVLGQIRDEVEPGRNWQTGSYPWWEQRLEDLAKIFGVTDVRGEYRQISVVAAYQQSD